MNDIELQKTMDKLFAKADLASTALDQAARANGRHIENADTIASLTRLLKAVAKKLWEVDAELTEARGDTRRHAARLNAHRSRLNALETTAPSRPASTTMAKSENPNDQAHQILLRAKVAAKDPQVLSLIEQAVRAGDLDRAEALVCKLELAGGPTMAKAAQIGPDDAQERADLLERADKATNDPQVMIRLESAIRDPDLNRARQMVIAVERSAEHDHIQTRASKAPQRVRDEVSAHLDNGDHAAALERIQNHEISSKR